MRRRQVLYRLEVNYLSAYYEDWALQTSTPIYNKREGMQKYNKAIKETCVDKKDTPARVHLWKYNWNEGVFDEPITIAKNY